jgi:glycosyltransferase involved in cell wall biosynthesis
MNRRLANSHPPAHPLLRIPNYSHMLFSIITVTYNAAAFIDRTLESIAAQSCRDFEVILVDGASKDETLQRAKRFDSILSTVLCEPDRGLYDAMNKGIQLAKGEYILFLNAGDTFHASTTLAQVQEQLTSGKRPNVIYGETELMDESGNSLGMRRLKAPEKLTANSFRNGMLVCHQSFWVRRDLAPAYNLQYRYSADFDWCIRVLKLDGEILNTHLTLSRFLQGGTSTQQRKASLKERYQIMVKHYGRFGTDLYHLWFAFRFTWAKLTGREL